MKNRMSVTLIELIIAMAISVFILGVLVASYIAGTSIFNSEMDRSAAFLEANKGISVLRIDLRNCLELTSAASASISFWAQDANSNGSKEAGEIFMYSWNGTPGSPLIKTVSGANTMVAKNISSFNLTYDSASLASIKQVNIKIASSSGRDVATLESSVKLRNL